MSAMPARAPQLTGRPIQVPVAKAKTRKRSILKAMPTLTPALETLHDAIPNEKANTKVFTFFVGGLFTVGLLLLLFVNTLTASASFEKSQLQQQVSKLTAQQQQLERKVAYQESPGQLLSVARKMGMVPAATPAFLRLSDHKILGVPQAAPAGH